MTTHELTDAYLYGGWTPEQLATLTCQTPTAVKKTLDESIVVEQAADCVRQMEATTLLAAYGLPLQ